VRPSEALGFGREEDGAYRSDGAERHGAHLQNPADEDEEAVFLVGPQVSDEFWFADPVCRGVRE